MPSGNTKPLHFVQQRERSLTAAAMIVDEVVCSDVARTNLPRLQMERGLRPLRRDN